MPVVIELPEVTPPIPPAEDASELWELLYASMGFHIEDDEANGFALRLFCEGLCAPLQPVYSLARERDEQKGWAIIFDPANAPAEALPYLAQYVGVEITPEMDEAQIRAEIEQPTGWRRGQAEPLRTAVRRTLTPVLPGEETRIIIRPRTPEPGHHQIRTWLSQTPDEDRTAAVIRAALPAWESVEYLAVTGMTYADVKAEEETYADVKADFATYKVLAETLP